MAIPASAGAATLSTNKTCYGGGDTVKFVGSGYTPNGAVSFAVDGQPVQQIAIANRGGVFGLSLDAPFTVSTTRRTQTVTATDQTNPAATASRPVQLSIVRVKVRPREGKPSRLRRFRATGFTAGRTLYAHKVRGKSKRTLRIGQLKGPCHSLSVRGKLFGPKAKVGKYRIQFDAYRTYKKDRKQKVPFTIQVFRNFGVGSSAASAAAAHWTGSLRTRWTRLAQ